MCVKQNETIEYYDNNAREYFEKSIAVDMSDLCERFLEYVPKGSSILDIGCGSGRDLRYFKEHGYQAEGLEPSAEMQKLAEEYSGCKVYLSTIQSFIPATEYDAIWACASLLHLNHEELCSFFSNIDTIIKRDGIIFISMKYGIQSGKDTQGRYFENFDEDTLHSILELNRKLRLVDQWKSSDNMSRDGVTWFNAIIKYE